MLPWLHEEISEMYDLMGDDPWPYGIEPNRQMLSAFSGYLEEQGFVKTVPDFEELFTPIVSWAE